jgi:non-specific serine/threonine protein kinase
MAEQVMKAPAKRKRSGKGVAMNLPTYQTSFIGRASDLDGIRSLLSRSRMVTLTGPGGAGKTRLAVELGRSLLDLWPDGIWWVDLVPVKDPAQMPWAVVAALELPGRGLALEVIAAWLAPRRAVLLLDNCEHLVAACAEFCQGMLAHCDRLMIVTTSREPLGVAGEAQWPVSSLAALEANAMFEARAQLALPDFMVTASNMRTVAEICDRLDRMPLAIELAAARIGMMPEEEILSQLSDRFRLLKGGSRTAHEKLKAMSAAIDWSYRLLTEDEAALFRRLSVFRGGFTLQSAAAVCGDGTNVFDLMTSLVQKSMVVAERKQGTGARYRLLESQLAYAEDRLREAGELEALRQGHYQHFRERLSTVRGSNPTFGLQSSREGWISLESGNLWAALAWARIHAADRGLSLAARLPYDAFGDLALLRDLIEDLLRQSNARDAIRVRALNLACGAAYKQGDYAAAISLGDDGLALARDLEDVEGEAQLLHWLGAAYEGSGDLDRAARNFEDGLALLNESSNYPLVNMVRGAMADLAVERGDYASARTLLAECIAAAKMSNDVGRIAASLESLAWAQRGSGEHRAAASSWREGLSLVRGLTHSLLIIDCLEGLSIAAEALKDDRRASCLAGAATRMEAEMSYRVDPWWRKQYNESHQRSRARLGRDAADEAWNQGSSMSWDQAVDLALAEGESETEQEAGPLSRRELEVARLVARGMTNRQIADQLVIAERTAEGHVEHIRNKLGFQSRAQVAVWFTERGSAQH